MQNELLRLRNLTARAQSIFRNRYMSLARANSALTLENHDLKKQLSAYQKLFSEVQELIISTH